MDAQSLKSQSWFSAFYLPSSIFGKSLLVLLQLVFATLVYSQNRTYLSIESGLKWEALVMDQRESDFDYGFQGYKGLSHRILVGREFLNGKLLVESGAGYMRYNIKYSGAELMYSYSETLTHTLQLPLRASYQVDLPIRGFSFNPALGYVLNFNLERSRRVGPWCTVGWDPAGYLVYGGNEPNLLFHLVEIGGSFDYTFSNDFTLYLGGQRFLGFKRVANLSWNHYLEKAATATDTRHSKGGYTAAVLGIKFPINKPH